MVVALDNPPREIRPGLSCTAKITTATRKNVISIPIQALTVRQKGQLEPKPDSKTKTAQAATKPDPVAEKAKKEEVQGVFVVADGQHSGIGSGRSRDRHLDGSPASRISGVR